MKALYQETYALVIGNSAYGEGWPSLSGVEEDIREVSETLKSLGFEVFQAENLNKKQLDSAFTTFIATHGTEEETGLLFYFAGHGHTIQTNYGEKIGYIVPVDAQSPSQNAMEFQSNATEMAQMEIYAKRIESKHAIFIFDACFSGSLFSMTRAIPEIISYKTTQPVRQFISSGTEDEEVSDESIFRKQFVDALHTGHADFNQDGFLTGTELGRFLQSTVINYTNNTQHPQYGKINNPALNKGDFVFVLPSGISEPINQEIQEFDSTIIDQPTGSIELSTEIGGDIYVDGKLLTSIAPNSIVPILDLASGMHHIEIKGSESWNSYVTVQEGITKPIQVKSQLIENPDGSFIRMVFIQGGAFKMGSMFGESDERPAHSTILNDFEISAFEVTVGQFRHFITETSYQTEAETEGWSWIFDQQWKKKPGYTWEMNAQGEPAKEYEPVRYVSWNDCQRFTEWLSEKSNETYRLPTEAEWEYAANGGVHNSSLKFAGSEYAELIGWFESNAIGDVSQVGKKHGNDLNLYDMSGNVWEWCLDWYNERYYERSPYSNPRGPLVGEYRVLRGGSWINNEESGRVTNRHKYRPEDRDNLTGFRVVKEIY